MVTFISLFLGLLRKYKKPPSYSPRFQKCSNLRLKQATWETKYLFLGFPTTQKGGFYIMKAKKWICFLMSASLIGLSLPAHTVQAQETAAEETETSDSDSGFEIEYDGELVAYTGAGGDIEIPERVTSIGDGAFSRCESITSVKLPKNCYSIGEQAFSYCKNLKKIQLPDALSSIMDFAFEGCASLNNVALPSGIESIGDNVFSDCASLTELHIPDSVTELGWGILSGCTSLTDVTLPEGMEELGGDFFADCTSLKSITLPDSVNLIQDFVFYNCASLKSITLPDNVEIISESAFEGCTSLTSIQIPANVNFIHKSTFKNCTSLTEITIPDRSMRIMESAFEGCTSLKSITLPDSISEIERYAFRNCTALESIRIPQRMETIGRQAFDGCTSLTDFQTSPAYGKFRAYGGILYDGLSKNLFCCPPGKTEAEITSTTTSIGVDAFRNCKNLTKLTIPEAVTSIDKEAFYGHSSAFIIYGKSGSYAEIYAREHAIPFQSTGQTTKDITQCSAVLSQVSYLFDGTPKTPAVTVKDGKVELTENVDYEVRYANNTSIGKAQAYITGIGKYRGAITLPFIIEKSEAQNPPEGTTPNPPEGTTPNPPENTTPNPPEGTTPNPPEGTTPNPPTGKTKQSINCAKTFKKTYGDAPFALNVQAAKDGGKLSYKSSAPKVAAVDRDGKVTIKGTGIATITIQAEETAKYKTAIVQAAIKVSPARQTVKSVKTGKGRKLTVLWKKDRKATGYQIQCCLNKNFKKGVKTLHANKYSVTSKTFSNLKKGKRYYVRVRSYKKVKANSKAQNLYSPWSKPKKSKRIQK